jgi:C1A family cysteine protease
MSSQHLNLVYTYRDDQRRISRRRAGHNPAHSEQQKMKSSPALPYIYSCLFIVCASACCFLALAAPAVARDDDAYPWVPFGPPGTAAPPGATIIAPQAFLDLLKQGALHLTTLRQGERDDERQEALDRFHATQVKQYLGQHPELTNLAQLLKNNPRPVDGIQPRGDGTWSMYVPAVQHSVVTLGRSNKLAAIYNSIVFAADRTANLNLYASLYNSLPGGYLESLDGSLVTPLQLSTSTLSDIQRALAALGHDREAILAHVTHQLPNLELSCQGETGAGIDSLSQGDRAGNLDYCTASPKGIYANFDFPNKSNNTCVKSQGKRAVCHTFAVTSATELQVSLKYDKKVNLSEQDLMEHYRLLWQPALQQETGDAFELANDIIANNYFQPYEDQWDFNPALYEYVKNGVLVNSCASYVSNEPCSNTAPEAPLVCASFTFNRLSCAYRDAGIHGSPYQLSSATRFWSLGDTENSTELMVLSLAFNNSVVIELDLSPAFQSAPGGYVPFDQADLGAPSAGGHVVHVIGFIGNDELHQKLPNAPPASGAGYFIVKNSWSNCSGDGGYYYLPWDYVKYRTVDGFSIGGVN